MKFINQNALIKAILVIAWFVYANTHVYAQRYTVGGYGLQAEAVFRQDFSFRNDFSAGFFYNLNDYKRLIIDVNLINTKAIDNEIEKAYKDYIGSLSYSFNIISLFQHGANLNLNIGPNLGYRHIDQFGINETSKEKGKFLYGGVAGLEVQLYILRGLSALLHSQIRYLGHLVDSRWLLANAVGLRYEFL